MLPAESSSSADESLDAADGANGGEERQYADSEEEELALAAKEAALMAPRRKKNKPGALIAADCMLTVAAIYKQSACFDLSTGVFLRGCWQ